LQSDDNDQLIALLTGVAGGSESALEALYRSVQARVYAFVVKRLRDPIEAADVVNEVMLDVWRHAARFEGRSRVLTWILGIAHHKALDALRRRREEPVAEPDIDVADDEADIQQALVGAQNAAWLRRCLDRLSDAHRTVVHLAFFDDLGYPEIAQILDCPVGTVKTRVFHAKRLLKTCLSTLMGEGAPTEWHAGLSEATGDV
jgi:RNA polymerase sigma-70 factor (ECF subfamily)